MLIRKKKRLCLAILNGKSPDGSSSAKYGIMNRLREIILAGGQPELPDKVLLAFLYHSKLLKLVFTPNKLKVAHKQVKKLIANDAEGSGLGETLDEIVAAACESDC